MPWKAGVTWGPVENSTQPRADSSSQGGEGRGAGGCTSLVGSQNNQPELPSRTKPHAKARLVGSESERTAQGQEMQNTGGRGTKSGDFGKEAVRRFNSTNLTEENTLEP